MIRLTNKLTIMKAKRAPITPQQHLEWSELAHAYFLGAIMRAARWQAGDLAFHGGTNLHLCWQSSRYSEDLDFLLCSSRKNMKETLDRAAKEVQTRFQARDPLFEIEVRDKTKDPMRMITQHLVVKHPMVIGQVMVKLEFWRADPLYMQRYATDLRTPSGPADFSGGIQSPVPSATLACAFADKLVAFSTRPHLKWRDIYDLWWIGTQTRVQIDEAEVLGLYLHNLQAYKTPEGMPAHRAILRIVDAHTDEQLIAAADPDLKDWLPESLWQQLKDHGLQEMVAYARRTLHTFSDLAQAALQQELQGDNPDEELSQGDRP